MQCLESADVLDCVRVGLVHGLPVNVVLVLEDLPRGAAQLPGNDQVLCSGAPSIVGSTEALPGKSLVPEVRLVPGKCLEWTLGGQLNAFAALIQCLESADVLDCVRVGLVHGLPVNVVLVLEDLPRAAQLPGNDQVLCSGGPSIVGSTEALPGESLVPEVRLVPSKCLEWTL